MNNSYKRSIWLIAIRVAANVVTLGAICLAMYMSYLSPEEGLLVFCQWFFGITVVTWYVAIKLCHFVRCRFADMDESLVLLPGQRHKTIMRWKVACPALALSRPART